VRPPRVVASAALIAVLASVAVAGAGLSRTPSPAASIDPNAFAAVRLDNLRGSAATTNLTPDTANDSAATIGIDGSLYEPVLPVQHGEALGGIAMPANPPVVVLTWHHDAEESWYGPGMYGWRTACGYILTTTLRGVAHRTLPCGTLVTFRNPYNGATITVPVVDRGPYVAGRQWDLTGGTCLAISHCWTGPLDWRFP
jgi:rare lipoprotein A (RlpA)-like double-psi beta-barrel protein